MSTNGNGVPSGEPISDRTRPGDETDTRSRLYTFPGGVFEIQEHPGDEPGVGVYLEYHPRQSYNDARTIGPGEETQERTLVDDETEPA